MDKINDVERLLDEIATIKKGISTKQIKRLKLDLLERIIKRVATLSENCNECKEYIENIKGFIDKFKREITTLENNNYSQYHKMINKIVAHLNKKHGLVTDGYYMSIYMAIGSGLGSALGAAFKNVGLGVALGISIGISMGSFLDQRAKKEGKVI